MGENIHDVFGPSQVKISRCDFFRNLLEHALERFWHETVPGAAPEHGLGLAIARAIVTGYGGSIELSNAPAGGAVASIHLDKDPSQR